MTPHIARILRFLRRCFRGAHYGFGERHASCRGLRPQTIIRRPAWLRIMFLREREPQFTHPDNVIWLAWFKTDGLLRRTGDRVHGSRGQLRKVIECVRLFKPAWGILRKVLQFTRSREPSREVIKTARFVTTLDACPYSIPTRASYRTGTTEQVALWISQATSREIKLLASR